MNGHLQWTAILRRSSGIASRSTCSYCEIAAVLFLTSCFSSYKTDDHKEFDWAFTLLSRCEEAL